MLISVSTFSPFTGFLLLESLSFFSMLSTFPKKILKIAPFSSLLEKAFFPFANLEFQILSYFLLDDGTDNVLYASFISFIFSYANVSPTFKSG